MMDDFMRWSDHDQPKPVPLNLSWKIDGKSKDWDRDGFGSALDAIRRAASTPSYIEQDGDAQKDP